MAIISYLSKNSPKSIKRLSNIIYTKIKRKIFQLFYLK